MPAQESTRSEARPARRPRGRPALRSAGETLEEIRSIAGDGDGLFRVHRRKPDLYARARRYFGTWSEAVRRAGLDYDRAVREARIRSREPLRKPAGRAR